MAHKIKCTKCHYRWTRRSTMNIARCPNCGGFQNLKKYPDRRFRKNRGDEWLHARYKKMLKKRKKTTASLAVPVSVPVNF